MEVGKFYVNTEDAELAKPSRKNLDQNATYYDSKIHKTVAWQFVASKEMMKKLKEMAKALKESRK